MDADDIRPRIARIWRGRTARDRADEYAAYLYEHGIRPLGERALGVQQLRQDRDEDTEFVTISYWASIEAMATFAGRDDPTRIHHLERDAEFLLELPESVQIMDITVSSGDTGGSTPPSSDSAEPRRRTTSR
jgi:heme-degrading monooxygenase HmoA